MLLNRQKYRFLQKNQLQRCTRKHLVSFPVHPRTPKSAGSAPSSTRWLLCSTVFLPPWCCRPKSILFQLLGLWLPLHSRTVIAKDMFGGGAVAAW
jgi:hypothetical protein